MPQVQFVDMNKGINVTSGMPTPRRITEIRWWLKVAQMFCKAIPRNIAETEWQVPQLNVSGDDPAWFILTTDVSERWIKFELQNRWGAKAHIVIDRKRDQFSGQVRP